ncbi:MAG: HIT family protein [Candidatus Thorarchaeota archaeon]
MECILCSVRDNEESVRSLKIYHDNILFISLNLYPYNPGHLMIVPNKHITQFTELSKEEIIHLMRTVQGTQMLLDHTYNPKGYNIGINQGSIAGGSIEHLHVHVVPRYSSELGYIDIVAETRVVPEGLNSVKEKLEQNINKFLNQKFFENF